MSIKRRENTRSRLRGVRLDVQCVSDGIWTALFAIRGFKKHLGSFTSEYQAAVAYDNFSEDYRRTRPNKTLRSDTKAKTEHWCRRCKEHKPLDSFDKRERLNFGISNVCKSCVAKNNAILKQRWISQLSALELENMKTRRKELSDIREAMPEKKERRAYLRKVRKAKAKALGIKVKLTPEQKLRSYYRLRVRESLKSVGVRKTEKTVELVGCSWSELRAHLESKFQPGMSWHNYGKWHVDHIKPCALHDITDAKQRHACFHYTNLQPLWAHDNLRKGKKLQLVLVDPLNLNSA